MRCPGRTAGWRPMPIMMKSRKPDGGARVPASHVHAIAVAAGACGGAAQHGGVTATSARARQAELVVASSFILRQIELRHI